MSGPRVADSCTGDASFANALLNLLVLVVSFKLSTDEAVNTVE